MTGRPPPTPLRRRAEPRRRRRRRTQRVRRPTPPCRLARDRSANANRVERQGSPPALASVAGLEPGYYDLGAARRHVRRLGCCVPGTGPSTRDSVWVRRGSLCCSSRLCAMNDRWAVDRCGGSWGTWFRHHRRAHIRPPLWAACAVAGWRSVTPRTQTEYLPDGALPDGLT